MKKVGRENGKAGIGSGLMNSIYFFKRLNFAPSPFHTFFDFSSAFNTTQSALLRVKLEAAGLDRHMATRTTVCLMWWSAAWGPPGYGAVPIPLHPIHNGLQINTSECHLQKYSDVIAIVGYVTGGEQAEIQKGHQGLCQLV